MADFLAALGAAAAVAQFIDYGFKLVNFSHELYKSTEGRLERYVVPVSLLVRRLVLKSGRGVIGLGNSDSVDQTFRPAFRTYANSINPVIMSAT